MDRESARWRAPLRAGDAPLQLPLGQHGENRRHRVRGRVRRRRSSSVPRAEQPPPPWLRNDYGVGRIHVAFVTRPVCKQRGLLRVVVAGDDASASSGAQWAGSLDLSSLEASAYCAAVAEQHSEWTFPVKWPPNAASR